MKKAIPLLLAFLLCIALCACGSAKAPSEKLVLEDLTNALHAENAYAAMEKYETVKSLTGEGTYEITFKIDAKSKYADWDYEVNMYYTKYDQGWKMDRAEFVSGEYTVTGMPDTADFIEYATDYLKNHEVYSDSTYLESMFPLDNLEIAPIDQSRFTANWVGSELFMHAYRYVSYTSQWQYDEEVDNWTLVPNGEDYYGYYLDDYRHLTIPNYDLDFSGTWTLQYIKDSTITISNFSWDGFDLSTSVKDWDVNGHYTPEKDGVYSSIGYTYFGNPDGSFVLFDFNDSNTYLIINDGHNLMGEVHIEHMLPNLN